LTHVSRSTTPNEFLNLTEVNVAGVRKAIFDKYGFEVTEEYARDFLLFVLNLLGGDLDDGA
jgi:hypothetical protein